MLLSIDQAVGAEPGIARRVGTDPEISAVIPAFNEQDNIATAIIAVSVELRQLGRSFEILVIDDGSADQTVHRAKALINAYPLRIICLSRNFGKENAISAGLEHARGAAVFIIDADLQEPVSAISTFVEKWDEGYEMIYAFREDRADEGLVKRAATSAFYWLLDMSTDCTIPRNARDFRLMDRKVVDAICSLPERNRFMKGIYSWVGFRTAAVPVSLAPRANGASKFNFRQLFDLAVTGLTSFTAWPLRVWTIAGLVISILSICYAVAIAVRTVIFGVDVPGWATLTVAVFFFGGVQLLSIGILGEYLSRVFSEVKARPGHIVSQKFESDRVAVLDRV